MKYLNGLILAIPLLFGIIHNNEINLNTYKGVYYDNFNYTDNVTFNGNDGLNIDYTANLNQVGDYYEISFNVINDSKVDMEITNCDYHKNDEFINYELTYANGKKVQQGDILKQGESKKMKYRVQYKKLIVENNYQVDTSFSINYEQII